MGEERERDETDGRERDEWALHGFLLVQGVPSGWVVREGDNEV